MNFRKIIRPWKNKVSWFRPPEYTSKENARTGINYADESQTNLTSSSGVEGC